MKKLIFAITFFLLFCPVLNIAAKELSLVEALEMSVQHAYAVEASRAQTKAYERSVKVAEAERLPTLSASMVSNYASEVTTFEIDIPGLQSFSNDYGDNETYQADLQLTMPLFTGGKISNAIELAEARRDYYHALELATEEQVIYRTRVEYLNLMRADRLVTVAKASLERAKIVENDVNIMFSAGEADSVDLLEMELKITQAEFELQQSYSNRRTAEIRLLIFLGLSPTDSIIINESLPEGIVQTDVSPVLASSKPELLKARAGVAMSNSQVELARSDFWPTFSVYGGYTYGRPNLDPFNNTWNDYFSAGAKLTWSFNLGNKTGAAVKEAQYGYRASLYEEDNITENLNRDLIISIERLKLAFEKYETARRHFRITSDNYNLARTKHRQGDLSSNRLLEIEASLTEAEASRAATLVDYYIARSNLYYAAGSEKLREGL